MTHEIAHTTYSITCTQNDPCTALASELRGFDCRHGVSIALQVNQLNDVKDEQVNPTNSRQRCTLTLRYVPFETVFQCTALV